MGSQQRRSGPAVGPGWRAGRRCCLAGEMLAARMAGLRGSVGGGGAGTAGAPRGDCSVCGVGGAAAAAAELAVAGAGAGGGEGGGARGGHSSQWPRRHRSWGVERAWRAERRGAAMTEHQI
jgi:hypothetical protein